jgi:glycosyltransferase involved in cell wall biosynthesis
MRILLFSPLARFDPPSGDISYTEALLAEPPPGVEYVTYADAIDQGLITVRGQRPTNGSFGVTDLTLLVLRAGERALRRRGMMFREPWWFVSIKPGVFDLVHQHLFTVRQIGKQIPVVSTAGYPLSMRYRDAEHWSHWRVRRAVVLEKTFSRVLRLHIPWLIGRPGNVLSGYSLKFWAFLVGHGAAPASTRVIGTGLQDLHLPPKQTSGSALAFIGRDFDRKGGTEVLRAFRILKGRHPALRLIVVTTIENIAAHSIVGDGITVLADLPREELLHHYLPHIDVLVSPTSSDCGAPYAILEALQSGACVVLSKNAWLDDRLVEPAVRRVDDGVSALVTELEDLLHAPNLARAKAAAMPLWHKAFSMTALHGDLLAAYAAVACPLRPQDSMMSTDSMKTSSLVGVPRNEPAASRSSMT